MLKGTSSEQICAAWPFKGRIWYWEVSVREKAVQALRKNVKPLDCCVQSQRQPRDRMTHVLAMSVNRLSFGLANFRALPYRHGGHVVTVEKERHVVPEETSSKVSITDMMQMPKLRREQRTEVPEFPAAATVGTSDAATFSLSRNKLMLTEMRRELRKKSCHDEGLVLRTRCCSSSLRLPQRRSYTVNLGLHRDQALWLRSPKRRLELHRLQLCKGCHPRSSELSVKFGSHRPRTL